MKIVMVFCVCVCVCVCVCLCLIMCGDNHALICVTTCVLPHMCLWEDIVATESMENNVMLTLEIITIIKLLMHVKRDVPIMQSNEINLKQPRKTLNRDLCEQWIC